jgi:hypothetical protein
LALLEGNTLLLELSIDERGKFGINIVSGKVIIRLDIIRDHCVLEGMILGRSWGVVFDARENGSLAQESSKVGVTGPS